MSLCEARFPGVIHQNFQVLKYSHMVLGLFWIATQQEGDDILDGVAYHMTAIFE